MNCADRAIAVFRQDLTLGSLMDRLAAAHGDRMLVEEPGGPTLTFAQAAARVGAMAAGISSGAGPGDRVVLATANGYDQFLLCLAASRAGNIAVPVNPQMRPEEVEHVVRDSAAWST